MSSLPRPAKSPRLRGANRRSLCRPAAPRPRLGGWAVGEVQDDVDRLARGQVLRMGVPRPWHRRRGAGQQVMIVRAGKGGAQVDDGRVDVVDDAVLEFHPDIDDVGCRRAAWCSVAGRVAISRPGRLRRRHAQGLGAGAVEFGDLAAPAVTRSALADTRQVLFRLVSAARRPGRSRTCLLPMPRWCCWWRWHAAAPGRAARLRRGHAGRQPAAVSRRSRHARAAQAGQEQDNHAEATHQDTPEKR